VLDGRFRRRTRDLTVLGPPGTETRLRQAGHQPDGSMAYSGDTEWTDALLAAADGVDLFLCEGYRPTPVKWHLDLETLARHRDRLTCRRLVLPHLSQAALDADLSGWEVAHDGMVLNCG
jgi:ribonuclease BN (tRNA processing enzyme)